MNTILLNRLCYKLTDPEHVAAFVIVAAYLTTTNVPTLLIKLAGEDASKLEAVDARKVQVAG